ncbi:MAG: hypothetical protein HOP14_06590 [Acidobacteria bacterium]|nr:hypothetical protein [Acidobacteriota bacterium]
MATRLAHRPGPRPARRLQQAWSLLRITARVYADHLERRLRLGTQFGWHGLEPMRSGRTLR